ncbi:hypothetical protein V6N13_054922 [Hibiscus sabdariffa]|uniref:Agglutinin domain-containing protein n=2 Tax=Hibiscus sabdariffa TaxID=183260 RepID=A0ABR2DWG4_9ROSI
MGNLFSNAKPRFIVLKCDARNKYLSYIHGDSAVNGYLKFSETMALSPFTKFEVERAKCSGEDDLVHIKSCRNNKYCERVENISITGNPKERYWIAATADMPVEDRSEETCTLFKLIQVDIATNKIRIMHVQSGCYLCLWWVDSPRFNYCVLANYKVFDGNSCDLFTVIDWELLANKAFASPRFIVLKSNANNKYLGFKHEGGWLDRTLQCSETHVVSPYAKFEVEMAQSGGTDGLVHIRSCQNNKYWRLSAAPVMVTADKPEEDQSTSSSTLFKLISVNDATNIVRIMHVQSKRFLLMTSEISFMPFVSARFDHFDDSYRDLFTIIDWESLLILPRYVAFKGNNNRYLCHRWIQGHPYLEFASGDIGDSNVTMEIFMTDDGNIRIKSICSGKFWRRSPNWIWADSDDTSSNNRDTLFRPVKVNNKTIALVNLGNHGFCKSLTTEGKTNCLNAAVPSVTIEAQLSVEEPVMERIIYNIKYDLDNSRIYDQSVLLVAKNSASNYTKQSDTLEVKLSYTDTKTSTWNANFSLKLGVKATFGTNLPLILKSKIELSAEIQSGIEWGETKTTASVVEVVHKVVVPPMTKVMVNLIATKGKCDVPFTFMQKDTLYNGNTVVSEVKGNTYTGSNYYNVDFETKEEPLRQQDTTESDSANSSVVELKTGDLISSTELNKSVCPLSKLMCVCVFFILIICVCNQILNLLP